MIAEALHYLTSYLATPPAFRQHVKASIGLWSRARRCAKAWALHEDNCQKFIASEIATMRQKRTAVILGSGLLRDVPIEQIAREFDTVVLIDLVHPTAAKTRIRSAKLKRKLVFINRDIGEGERCFAGEAFEAMAFLRDVPFLDLVISANLLSQMGIAAQAQLEASGRENEVHKLVPQIINGHLDRLSALPCKALLLTDIAYDTLDKHGAIIESHDLLFGIEPPKADKSWQWMVAPLGELSQDYSINHHVIAKVMN
jgi:hypothetical protein